MLDWSVEQNKYPVAIRVPMNFTSTGVEDNTDYSKLNKYKLVEKGENIAIIGLGNFFDGAKTLKADIKKKLNIDSTLINPIYITGLDYELLEELKNNHRLVITLEDGILDGGFGEKIARFYGNSDMKVLNYGAKKEFTDRTPIENIYEDFRLYNYQIIEDVEKIMNKIKICSL